ncbi:Hypothetical predicted protein [Marmota monax]|uniref:Uncharacterized protein n=1 Tax=Marmota monax TaxID=9995 RepID=A0A5E4AKB7_MARMO|nr:Hypothetical predicted protein [Marmota monax]
MPQHKVGRVERSVCPCVTQRNPTPLEFVPGDASEPGKQRASCLKQETSGMRRPSHPYNLEPAEEPVAKEYLCPAFRLRLQAPLKTGSYPAGPTRSPGTTNTAAELSALLEPVGPGPPISLLATVLS